MEPVARKVASVVFTRRLIWFTETPKSAGIMSVRICFTPGWFQANLGRLTRRSFITNGI